MTLPANIRVNTPVPFPSLVTGSGPVAISKKNGIWNLGLSFLAVGIEAPPVANYGTDYILVYDNVAKSFFTMSLATFGGARPQRLVTAGPVAFVAGDQVINLKLSGVFTSTLPSYVLRSGFPLTLCDVTKLYGVTFFAQTFNAAAGETIDGEASVTINQPGQSITLLPMNDGTSVGWKQI